MYTELQDTCNEILAPTLYRSRHFDESLLRLIKTEVK